MLQTGADHNNYHQITAVHSSNCQIMLQLFECDKFCNNLQHKKFQANLEVSDVLIT